MNENKKMKIMLENVLLALNSNEIEVDLIEQFDDSVGLFVCGCDVKIDVNYGLTLFLQDGTEKKFKHDFYSFVDYLRKKFFFQEKRNNIIKEKMEVSKKIYYSLDYLFSDFNFRNNKNEFDKQRVIKIQEKVSNGDYLWTGELINLNDISLHDLIYIIENGFYKN